MKRIIYFLLIAPLLFSGCKKKKPIPMSFIIIFTDDLGYGDLSSYGHPTIQTPNLDRMASEGQKIKE
jgi:arylsulfatase A-like enzyme